MSDEIVIRCCAPTLAAIKTGSLFNCQFASRGEMTASLRAINYVLFFGFRLFSCSLFGEHFK